MVRYAERLHAQGRQTHNESKRASAACFPKKYFDQIFIVFDEDEKPKKRLEATNLIKELNKKYARDGLKVFACESIPCFEIWPLLHFEHLNPHHYTIKDIENKLQQHIPDYEKPMPTLCEKTIDKLDRALRNAKKLRESPDREEGDALTRVDLLVTEFQKLSDKQI